LVFRCFDYAATFAWALSGAALGARRGYDFTGVFALAVVSSCGGGLLRDAVFLQSGPPALVRTPVYLLIAATVALVICLTRVRSLVSWRPLVLRTTAVADALGLGAFAVVGTRLALAASIGLVGATLIGVVNAVGGGFVRSVIVRETPEVLKPGTLTALAAFGGVVLYLVLSHFLGVAEKGAALAAIACVAALRFASVHFQLHTSPAWSPDSQRCWREQLALPSSSSKARAPTANRAVAAQR
jgi:uncharacterized membrane protein YeiH